MIAYVCWNHMEPHKYVQWQLLKIKLEKAIYHWNHFLFPRNSFKFSAISAPALYFCVCCKHHPTLWLFFPQEAFTGLQFEVEKTCFKSVLKDRPLSASEKPLKHTFPSVSFQCFKFCFSELKANILLASTWRETQKGLSCFPWLHLSDPITLPQEVCPATLTHPHTNTHTLRCPADFLLTLFPL